jgi:hypothetical protein
MECRLCGSEDRARKYRVQISYGRYECIVLCARCEPAMAEVITQMRDAHEVL